MAGTTIDKLDISVYNLYALRTRMIEQINQQYRLEEAQSIPPQIQVMNTIAQLTELDLLLGTVALNTPWAYFFPPQQYHTRRRSPFSFAKIIPSVRSTDEGSEEYTALFDVECESPDEERERKTIANCFKEISKLNNWLGFIIGRVGQFLQG
jgi:hypothetical protein